MSDPVYTYALDGENPRVVIRSDGVAVPIDTDGNHDTAAYKDWLAAGNTPSAPGSLTLPPPTTTVINKVHPLAE